MWNLSRALIWQILPLMMFFPGCTGFKQAYEERICWKNGLPGECTAHYITLLCQEIPYLKQPSKSALPLKKVFVESVDGPANPQVGYLFSQNQIDDPPIFLTGESPWVTLQRDLKVILGSYGLKIEDDKQDIDGIVEGNITLLDVRTTHGGWLDFKVPTKARASFEVTIMGPDGQMMWKQKFSGSSEIMVTYASLKDSQNLLGQAYCQALSRFASTFESTFSNK